MDAAAPTLSEVFEGRRVAFAHVPPPPPRPVRGRGSIIVRALLLVLVLAAAFGAGYAIWRASGYWFVGLIVFLIIAWIAALLGVGMVGAVKVEREGRARAYAKALEDPIGTLLPNRGSTRRERDDPASYARLLALPGRPVLVIDRAYADLPQFTPYLAPLAPRGQMPEPELLPVSRSVPGTSIAGLLMLLQYARSVFDALEAMWLGRMPVGFEWMGVAILLVAILLIATDPWLRRKLGLGMAPDASVGAGWLRDARGNLFTVDDSLIVLTYSAGGMEVRCISPRCVSSFYLVTLDTRNGALRKPKTGFLSRTLRKAASSVGAEGPDPAARETPDASQPLRLLISSWTYPEPRTDLAPHHEVRGRR